VIPNPPPPIGPKFELTSVKPLRLIVPDADITTFEPTSVIVTVIGADALVVVGVGVGVDATGVAVGGTSVAVGVGVLVGEGTAVAVGVGVGVPVGVAVGLEDVGAGEPPTVISK
jgi:hypothetical protein